MVDLIATIVLVLTGCGCAVLFSLRDYGERRVMARHSIRWALAAVAAELSAVAVSAPWFVTPLFRWLRLVVPGPGATGHAILCGLLVAMVMAGAIALLLATVVALADRCHGAGQRREDWEGRRWGTVADWND